MQNKVILKVYYRWLTKLGRSVSNPYYLESGPCFLISNRDQDPGLYSNAEPDPGVNTKI